MQVKNQQLEPDMEQQTGSKSAVEYIKAVCSHTACLFNLYTESIIQAVNQGKGSPFLFPFPQVLFSHCACYPLSKNKCFIYFVHFLFVKAGVHLSLQIIFCEWKWKPPHFILNASNWQNEIDIHFTNMLLIHIAPILCIYQNQ